LDIDRIAPGSYVGDVVLKAEVTPFLHAVKAKGCTIQVGSDMLFGMITACLEFFGFGSATPDLMGVVGPGYARLGAGSGRRVSTLQTGA